MNDHLDYTDYEKLIRTARMERSIALGNAIASVVNALVSAFRHGIQALTAGSGKAEPRQGANAHDTLDLPVHL